MQRPCRRALQIAVVCLCSSLLPQNSLAADTAAPQVIHESCETFTRGQPLTIIARFHDESAIWDAKIAYRTRGQKKWRTIPMSLDSDTGNYEATIPAAQLRGHIEYFVEVFDELGNGPARLGDRSHPLRTRPVRSAEPCTQVPKFGMTMAPTSASPAEPEPPPSDWAVSDETPAPEASPSPTPPQEESAAFKLLTKRSEPPAESACAAVEPPLYCEVWLWAVIGGALAIGGGSVGIYFATQQGGGTGNSSGKSRLTINGPSPTAAPLVAW